jgi:hypothetical protein
MILPILIGYKQKENLFSSYIAKSMSLRGLFKPAGIQSAYNGFRRVIGSISRPINKYINKAADTVLGIDDLIKKNSDHPILRDLAGMLTNNPIYGEIINFTKDFRDGANIINKIGDSADNVISGELNKLNPKQMDSPEGAVAEKLNLG